MSVCRHELGVQSHPPTPMAIPTLAFRQKTENASLPATYIVTPSSVWISETGDRARNIPHGSYRNKTRAILLQTVVRVKPHWLPQSLGTEHFQTETENASLLATSSVIWRRCGVFVILAPRHSAVIWTYWLIYSRMNTIQCNTNSLIFPFIMIYKSIFLWTSV